MARALLLLVLAASWQPSLARDTDDFLAARVEDIPAKQKVTLAEQEGEELYTIKHIGTTRYSHETYGDKVKEAFVAAIVGVIMVCLAYPILWFNEKRQVHMDEIFGYAKAVCVQNLATDNVDPDNQARVVHVVGETSTEETLRDDTFAEIEVTNCAHLKREVEMYQWQETIKEEKTDSSGGGQDVKKTPEYSQVWSSSPISSSSFMESGYENPAMPFEGKTETASTVNFGAFLLPSGLVSQMRTYTSLDYHDTLQADGRTFASDGDTFTTVQGEPQIGDMRVTFTKVECGDATVAAVQNENTFVPLTFAMIPPKEGCCGEPPVKVELPEGLNEGLLSSSSKGGNSGCCACVGDCVEIGESLFELEEQKDSFDGIMDRAAKAQSCVHIGLQLLGFFLFFTGFYLQFDFVPTLFRIIPFIGTWLQYFGSWFAMISACLCGCTCFCGTLAVSWLGQRPLKAVMLLIFAAAAFGLPTYLADMNASGHLD